MAFSFSKKDRPELTKAEMETFFIILKGFLKIGFSPLEDIKTLSDNEPEGKRKNVIGGIEYETHEMNRPLQNVLLSKKLITPLEHTIMSKSISMISSIDTILDKLSLDIQTKVSKKSVKTQYDLILFLISELDRNTTSDKEKLLKVVINSFITTLTTMNYMRNKKAKVIYFCNLMTKP